MPSSSSPPSSPYNEGSTSVVTNPGMTTNSIAGTSMDQEVRTYTIELVRRLGNLLRARLHAVYVIGSLALGDCHPKTSDIDIMAVSDWSIGPDKKREIVAALSHPNLVCPTRGLEFVLYEKGRAAVDQTPHFEINLTRAPKCNRASPSTHPANSRTGSCSMSPLHASGPFVCWVRRRLRFWLQ
jgi:hypothetical protein